MTPPFPAGTLVRPAELADAKAILAILHANSLALTGEIDASLQGVLDTLHDPDLDVASDTRAVIAPDGRLVAYAELWAKGREALPIVDIYLHHDIWETDTVTEPWLLAWAEARAWEGGAQIAPDLRLALRTFSDTAETRYIQTMERAGFTQIRHSFRMGITFDGPPDPGQTPDGLTLRAAEPGDMLAVFEAWRDAWRDHFGYIERPYEVALEAWRYEWEKDFAPGLTWLACDGDVVAGFTFNLPEYGGDQSAGFVELVAVRRAYRRRGIAEAALRRGLAALHAAGKQRAILYVDGASLTGATRLYEKAGLSVLRTYTLLEKELRPGVDPSTREAS